MSVCKVSGDVWYGIEDSDHSLLILGDPGSVESSIRTALLLELYPYEDALPEIVPDSYEVVRDSWSCTLAALSSLDPGRSDSGLIR